MANWLSLIYKALRDEIRASRYIQADETFIKYQDSGVAKTKGWRRYFPARHLFIFMAMGFTIIGVVFRRIG